jgi:folate-binding protein YgfZ
MSIPIAPAGYEEARSSAAFFPVTDGARLRLVGPDSQDFLNRLVSNEVKALPPGHGVYATMLDINGRMLADLWAWVLDTDNVLVETAAAAKPALMAALDKYLIMEQVEIHDASDTLALLTIQGPRALAAAAKALGADLPALEPNGVWESAAGAEEAIVAVRDRSGHGGVDIYVAADRLTGVERALETEGVIRGTTDALEILRVEAGIPRWGAELTDTVIPLEANLGGVAVSFTTGCYPGQEIIARIHSRGKPARSLAGLRFPDGPPPAGTDLVQDGKTVGKVTSAVVSPRLGGLALGYLRKETGEPGTAVSGGGMNGAVAKLPFSGDNESTEQIP